MKAVLAILAVAILATPVVEGDRNDVSYGQSKDRCKYEVLRMIQEQCDSRIRRRQVADAAQKPGGVLGADLQAKPPSVAILGLPNEWNWNQEELEALDRVRRLSVWQLYEKCCRDKRTQCNPPDFCGDFD